VELRLNDLFENPTPAGLAGRIREIRGAAGGRPEDRDGTGPATGHTRVDRAFTWRLAPYRKESHDLEQPQ
jgi:hypothetical protein